MKKLVLIASLTLLTLTYFSQSNDLGVLNLSGGVGAGVYATNSEINATYFGGSLVITDRDTSAGVTTYGYLSGDFGIIKLLSAGFYLQSGQYLQEDTAGITKDNSLFKIGIMPKLYLVNKDKFNLYTGLGLGYEKLRTSEEDNNSKTEAKYSGTNFHLRLGMNAYFTNSIGMFFHLGYDANNLTLNELSFTSGSNTNTPSNLTGYLDAKGMEVAIGLNFKFVTAK